MWKPADPARHPVTSSPGLTFVVEMQLLHVAGFINRVVYNACKAYVDQLKTGEPYNFVDNVRFTN